MADNVTWRGGAPAVAQVDTVEITAYNADTSYTLTINNLPVTVRAVTDTTLSAAALADAVNASTIPEFTEITATSAGAVVVLTADTPGTPFTAVSSKSGTGTIGAVTASVASSGPEDWSTAANWYNEDAPTVPAVPVAAEQVFIGESIWSIKYGLAQSAVTLTELHVLPSFTGRIGLPRVNANGYAEYRATGLAISSDEATIDGSNALQINIDFGSVTTLVTVNGSGTPDDARTPTILITGTNATNNAVVNKGTVGFGFFPDGAATDFLALGLNYISVLATDANVTVGATADIGNVTQNGGVLYLDATTAVKGAEQVVISAGTCYIQQPDATPILTLIIYGGTVYYSSKAVTTNLIVAGGTLDFRRGDFGPVFTNTSVYAGATILDPHNTAVFTNGLDLVQCSLLDVTLDLGKHIQYDLSAI